MTVLIIAEHNNQQLNHATLHAVTAAAKLGEVHVLVAGNAAAAVAEQAKQVAGVAKVLLADAPHYGEGLAEELAPLVVSVAGDKHVRVTINLIIHFKTHHRDESSIGHVLRYARYVNT